VTTAASGWSPAARARQAFVEVFSASPSYVALAPGRVNLIGEHTDYNDGFVLPMAIDRVVAAAVRPRRDDVVKVHAPHYGETCSFEIAAPVARPREWDSYVAGVVWALAVEGHPIRGVDLAIVSDVPIGAGLSSSAALELAVARAICAAAGIVWHPLDMARLAQRAEHEFVGVACGIMDQFASAMGVEGAALLLDCRTLDSRPVPIPPDAAVVIMDTGVRRSLAGSEYNSRRAACARAVAAAQRIEPRVTALRDVGEELLRRVSDRMDEEAYRCARHVISEISRPPTMALRLEQGDLRGAGQLMNDSHASLRDLFRVSCDELDAMVNAAQAQAGCYGARLTGAGFGGCAVALVSVAEIPAFVEQVADAYRRATSRDASMFTSTPGAGAQLA
jgi:galactokinase